LDMRLSRFHFDVAFLGGLLLLGAVVVRGWMADDARPKEPDVQAAAPASPQTAPRPRLARAGAVPRRQPVNLLDHVDPRRDAVAGEWTLRDGALVR
jgi:hypothetical protein